MKIKIPITRRLRYNIVTMAIYVLGTQAAISAFRGYVVGGFVLLMMALVFTTVRDLRFPLEVHGLRP